MIKIEKNENFKGWFNILVGRSLVDQVQSRGNALKIANKLCKTHKQKGFMFMGFPMMKGEK